MKQIKLNLNLGVNDAKRFGLDPKNTLEGTVVSVEPDAADTLLRRGWASDPGKDTAVAPDVPPVNPVTPDLPPLPEKPTK